MTEIQLYGKDGLFHNIVKKSGVFNGRYAILAKGGTDLNMNNLISGIELPQQFKYPGVFCLPPISDLPATVQPGTWECFYCRMLFLCTTGYTGDNKLKSPDPNTNTSLHTVPMDWNDMKNLALSFLNALEKTQQRLRGEMRLKQKDEWRISRLSKVQNDNLSGVLVQFAIDIAAPCEFADIDVATIELPINNHQTHFH